MSELAKNDAMGPQTSSPKKGRKSPKSKKSKKARKMAGRCAVALKMIAAGKLRSAEEAAEITEDSPESIFRLQRALAYGDMTLAEAILQGDRTIGNVDTWLRHPDRKDTVESILNTRMRNVVIPPDISSLLAEAGRLEAEAARLEQVVGGTSISGGLRVPSINTEAMQLKQQANNLREQYRRRSSPLLLLAMETLAALSHLLPPDTDSGQTVP